MRVKQNELFEIRAKGGKARAENLSSKELSEIGKKGAEARWNNDYPTASHQGNLRIGDADIQCYVLEDETRLLARIGVLKAIGRKGKAKGGRKYDAEFQVPVFLTAQNLKPFVSDELIGNSKPVIFTHNGTKMIGYKAELLPQICEVFLDAKEAKALRYNQTDIAEKCKILYRGFANVGIIGLVDEATGFQYDRAKTALAKILKDFISKELLKWVKTFQNEFYEQICRLKGVQLSDINKRPAYFGKITNDLVYARLAPNILEELKKVTEKDEKGRLKHHLHRRLTTEIGHPKLKEHLAAEIAVMRLFDDGDWDGFYKALNRTLPKQTKLPLFEPPTLEVNS